MKQELREQIIQLIQKEVIPALGCTEPISVALAVTKARETLGCEPEKVTVYASPNILKNGMGVGIPGTGKVGLHIAAALGVVTGKSSDELELLKDVTQKEVDAATALVDAKRIAIELKPTQEKLYIEVHCSAGNDESTAIIRGCHNHFSLILKNKEIIEDVETTVEVSEKQNSGVLAVLDIPTIFEFATTAPLEELQFIMAGANMNDELSRYGLAHHSGLGVGSQILEAMEKDLMSKDAMNLAVARTAAASDARMSGAMLPAMSNSGSGNQGITVMMPVVAYASHLEVGDEQLCRALILSNLTSIYIKQYFGRLSAACGCVVASTGAACGITYLLGGGVEQIKSAIKNMIANLTGMVCDGAKLGCALKVSTGTYAAIQSAIFASNSLCVSANDGIIEECVENTIKNLGNIATNGMNAMDQLLLQIMSTKKQ